MSGRTPGQKDIPEVNGARPQLGDIAPAVLKIEKRTKRASEGTLVGSALLAYLRG